MFYKIAKIEVHLTKSHIALEENNRHPTDENCFPLNNPKWKLNTDRFEIGRHIYIIKYTPK